MVVEEIEQCLHPEKHCKKQVESQPKPSCENKKIFGEIYFWNRRRQWHPTPVLLPGKSHGRRSLVGCSPWGREELDTTEQIHFHFSLSCTGERNGNPLQCSCLENPRDRGAWWAAVYGVAQSRTRLKRLSSSTSELCRVILLRMYLSSCRNSMCLILTHTFIFSWQCFRFLFLLYIWFYFLFALPHKFTSVSPSTWIHTCLTGLLLFSC